MIDLYMTRHAQYECGDKEKPTQLGIYQAKEKARKLQEAGFAASGLILSSNAPHAVETAQAIKTNLGVRTLVKSPWLRALGLYPQPVEDVHKFVTGLLGRGYLAGYEGDILLVTHAPLVLAYTDITADNGVYDIPTGWKNPNYLPEFAKLQEDIHKWLR